MPYENISEVPKDILEAYHLQQRIKQAEEKLTEMMKQNPHITQQDIDDVANIVNIQIIKVFGEKKR